MEGLDLKYFGDCFGESTTKYLAAMAAVFSLGASSAACCLAACPGNGDEARPSLTIRVTHGDKPLAGVDFKIVGSGTEQFSGVTDENGTVHVQRLAPGLYWLSGIC